MVREQGFINFAKEPMYRQLQEKRRGGEEAGERSEQHGAPVTAVGFVKDLGTNCRCRNYRYFTTSVNTVYTYFCMSCHSTVIDLDCTVFLPSLGGKFRR